MPNARNSHVRGLSVRGLSVAAVLAVVVAFSSAPAFGDTLIIDPFTGAAVSNPAGWVSGSLFPPYSACLTAGSNTTQTPIPGCMNPATDAVGSGALQLTSLTGNDGFALYNQALPTSGGLDISFDQAQWGGTGADGLAMFLVDGSTDLTVPGASGGNLGYSPSDQGFDGVANGLIGIGIDSFGNFSNVTTLPGGASNPDCTAASGQPGSAGPGPTPDRIVIRGPGNGKHGYCWLGASGAIGELTGATRAAATHLVHVVVDPDTVATRHVTVFLDGTQVLQIPAPAELLAATSFKFGFSASIGGANDNHDVWNLTINSVNPITPVTTTLAPTTTAAAAPTQAVTTQPAFTG